ncbi:MAG: hypothetical protein ACLTN0_03465 [Coprococcus phoceensis]
MYKKWGKALKLLSADPGYPSLQTHEIEPLSRRYGMKVWQSYLENKTSGCNENVLGLWMQSRKILQLSDWSHIRKIRKMAHTTEFHCRICRIKLNMEQKHEQLVYEK